MKNGKIGVGVIGVHPERGWARTAHIPAIRSHPDYELVALTRSDAQTARQAAHTFNVPYAFQSHLDLLKIPEIDLVVVTVKVPQHFALVSAALKAGKSVYCEWPLGRDLAEAVAVSGIFWGATLPASSLYTLDPKNGAGMIHVSFAHGLDAVSYALDAQITELTATLGTRRKAVQIIETNDMVPMTTPDQIIMGGTLADGTLVSVHYRRGLSRGTNFRWEINGTRGDLVVTSSLGYPAVGEATIQGGQGDDIAVHDLPIPSQYTRGNVPSGPGQAVFYHYARLAEDLRTGTQLSATFDDAVVLHKVIDAVETSAKSGSRKAL